MNECSAALEGQPTFFKALVRRAKAHEAMGHLKQALSDLQKANRLDAATGDSRDAERRLRESLAGKGGAPAGVGNGLARKGAVPSKATQSRQVRGRAGARAGAGAGGASGERHLVTAQSHGQPTLLLSSSSC